MKRILIASLLSLLCLAGSAQNAVTRFVARTDTSRLSLDYSFTVFGKTRIMGSGTAMVQGNAFKVEGGGLDIYCNGTDRWIVDEVEQEVAIEPVGPELSDASSNPVALIGAINELFNIGPMQSGTFQKKQAQYSILTPRADLDLSLMKLYFKGDLLIGIIVTMSDDSLTEIAVSNLKFSPKEDKSDFVFDTGKLDASWMVNDLR